MKLIVIISLFVFPALVNSSPRPQSGNDDCSWGSWTEWTECFDCLSYRARITIPTGCLGLAGETTEEKICQECTATPRSPRKSPEKYADLITHLTPFIASIEATLNKNYPQPTTPTFSPKKDGLEGIRTQMEGLLAAFNYPERHLKAQTISNRANDLESEFNALDLLMTGIPLGPLDFDRSKFPLSPSSDEVKKVKKILVDLDILRFQIQEQVDDANEVEKNVEGVRRNLQTLIDFKDMKSSPSDQETRQITNLRTIQTRFEDLLDSTTQGLSFLKRIQEIEETLTRLERVKNVLDQLTQGNDTPPADNPPFGELILAIDSGVESLSFQNTQMTGIQSRLNFELQSSTGTGKHENDLRELLKSLNPLLTEISG